MNRIAFFIGVALMSGALGYLSPLVALAEFNSRNCITVYCGNLVCCDSGDGAECCDWHHNWFGYGGCLGLRIEACPAPLRITCGGVLYVSTTGMSHCYPSIRPPCTGNQVNDGCTQE